MFMKFILWGTQDLVGLFQMKGIPGKEDSIKN